MTIKSGFHNSVGGDRKYNAEDMNRPYKDIVSNGVFPNPSDQLQVYASSGMTVSVSAGGGLFGNGWAYNDAPELLTLDSAEATLPRIDAVIIHRDESEAVRNSTLMIKKGTPERIPVAPEMLRGEYINEYCLATIYVAPDTTVITQSLITDTRPNTEVCGWVTGLIDQVDTTTLFEQWKSAYSEQYEKFMNEFEVWYAGIKDMLKDNESAVGEILMLKEEKANREAMTTTLYADEWELSDGYYYQNISVTNMKEKDIVLVAPDPSTSDNYANGGILAVEQTTGVLRFRSSIETEAVVNIVNLGSKMEA